MSDTTSSHVRPPGPRARAAGAGEDHRLHRLPAHAAVQFADQHPDHDRQRAAAVVYRRAHAEIPAGRCRLDRHGPHRLPPQESRRCGRRLLALHSGQVLAVHLRILSGAGTLAGQPDLLSCRDPADAAADSAAAGQGPERHPVLPGIPRHRLLPAARRRAGGLRRELDGRAVVGLQRQHRRWRKETRGVGRNDRRDRAVAVGARQADRGCSAC